MNWLEVSLTVDGELAEAVAEVLGRFAPGGVVTEQAVAFTHAEDEGSPAGPITVRAYLPADQQLEEQRVKLEQALFYLGMIRPLPSPTFTPIADQDWMESWKVHYQPIPIGQRLIIVPAWLDSPDPGRLPIRIDPGMAFGTGTHPSTQLCLQLLEEFTPPGGAVIDIGCGSGILSIAALKLGASHVLGVDIDETAVRSSRENAAANGISEQAFELGVGSVEEVKRGGFRIQAAGLVVANILAPVLIRLLSAGLADLRTPGGALLLAGILAEQGDGVIQAGGQAGLRLAKQLTMGDWVALVLS